MKLSIVLIFAITAATTFGNPVSQNEHIPNEVIDTVMEVLQQVIQESLDPMGLPQISESFSEKFLGVTLTGKIKAFDGRLQGLSTIRRNGPTHLDMVNNDSALKLTTSLALDRLNAGYSSHAQFMALKVSPSATASVSNIQFDLEAQACLQHGCSLQLTKFQIRDIGHIDVKINGLGGLGRVLGPLTGAIGNQIKRSLYNAIEGPIKNLLSEELRKVPDVSELYSALSNI